MKTPAGKKEPLAGSATPASRALQAPRRRRCKSRSVRPTPPGGTCGCSSALRLLSALPLATARVSRVQAATVHQLGTRSEGYLVSWRPMLHHAVLSRHIVAEARSGATHAAVASCIACSTLIPAGETLSEADRPANASAFAATAGGPAAGGGTPASPLRRWLQCTPPGPPRYQHYTIAVEESCNRQRSLSLNVQAGGALGTQALRPPAAAET